MVVTVGSPVRRRRSGAVVLLASSTSLSRRHELAHQLNRLRSGPVCVRICASGVVVTVGSPVRRRRSGAVVLLASSTSLSRRHELAHQLNRLRSGPVYARICASGVVVTVGSPMRRRHSGAVVLLASSASLSRRHELAHQLSRLRQRVGLVIMRVAVREVGCDLRRGLKFNDMRFDPCEAGFVSVNRN